VVEEDVIEDDLIEEDVVEDDVEDRLFTEEDKKLGKNKIHVENVRCLRPYAGKHCNHRNGCLRHDSKKRWGHRDVLQFACFQCCRLEIGVEKCHVFQVISGKTLQSSQRMFTA